MSDAGDDGEGVDYGDYGGDDGKRKKRDVEDDRPNNKCGDCKYVWKPRGKGVSARCPRCRSRAVSVGTGCLIFFVVIFIFGAVTWVI